LKAYRHNEFKEAKKLFVESVNLSLIDNCAPVTRITSLNAMYSILSQEGARKESIALLEAIYPEAAIVGQMFPTLIGDVLNNWAFEKYEASELKLAYNISIQACALPVSIYHPEWHETKVEIEAKMKEQPSKDLVFIPQNFESEKPKIVPLVNDIQPEPQDTPADVLGFKKRAITRSIKACLYKEECTLTLFDLLVTERETNDVLIALNQILGELESYAKGSIVCLRIYCDEEIKKEEFISESSINYLYETLRIYAAIRVSEDEEDEENLDEESTGKLLIKVIDLIEAKG
jgi:hypothetical protein